MDDPSVTVLGDGIGGLSAAHELAERGFDVTVYERKADSGGKHAAFRSRNVAIVPRSSASTAFEGRTNAIARRRVRDDGRRVRRRETAARDGKPVTYPLTALRRTEKHPDR